MYFRKLTTDQAKIKGVRKFNRSSTLITFFIKISLNLGSNLLKHKQQLFGFLETFYHSKVQLRSILRAQSGQA